MLKQGLWDDEKQTQHDKLLEDINGREDALKGGGIRLSDAKKIALELRDLRIKFRDLIAERNALDANSAEGQADNARFAELVRLCILHPETIQVYFPSQADYDAQADQPWVLEASSELANMLYGLDPDYDNQLEENKFLKEFNFVNDDFKFINEDGHLVDSEGRLVNEDGRYVAYRTEKAQKNQDVEQRYFVNKKGEELVERETEDGATEWVKADLKERKPFLDDDDNPIENKSITEEKPKNTKRKSRTTKTDAETV